MAEVEIVVPVPEGGSRRRPRLLDPIRFVADPQARRVEGAVVGHVCSLRKVTNRQVSQILDVHLVAGTTAPLGERTVSVDLRQGGRQILPGLLEEPLPTGESQLLLMTGQADLLLGRVQDRLLGTAMGVVAAKAAIPLRVCVLAVRGRQRSVTLFTKRRAAGGRKGPGNTALMIRRHLTAIPVGYVTGGAAELGHGVVQEGALLDLLMTLARHASRVRRLCHRRHWKADELDRQKARQPGRHRSLPPPPHEPQSSRMLARDLGAPSARLGRAR